MVQLAQGSKLRHSRKHHGRVSTGRVALGRTGGRQPQQTGGAAQPAYQSRGLAYRSRGLPVRGRGVGHDHAGHRDSGRTSATGRSERHEKTQACVVVAVFVVSCVMLHMFVSRPHYRHPVDHLPASGVHAVQPLGVYVHSL